MKQFIDRENELNVLNNEYASNRKSMVVLYGRRRVGKTALIQEFIKDKSSLYVLATEESESQNRDAFRIMIAEHFDNFFEKSNGFRLDNLI